MRENNFKIDSASISDRGLSKKRPNNEDSYLELNLKGLFAVADGVGGAQAGDVASQMAMEILGEAFNNIKPNEDAEEMMRVAVERANSAIYQMSQDLPQLSTMATTIVALHLSGNIGTIGHVGDSRLYRLDEKGNLYRETNDHSVVEEEVRAGRMTVAQAANHPSRNIISRALGADSSVEVDMKTIMFEPNTAFLLCSDGITRHIDDFELRELLASSDSPSQICQKMKEICYERGAEDNLTAVIAKVSNVVAGNGQPPVRYDVEEATVATARTSAQTTAEPPNILELGDEIPTQQLKMPPSENLPPIELEVAPTPQIAPQEEFVPPVEEVAAPEPVFNYDEEEVSYTEPEEVYEEPKEIEKQPVVVAEPASPPTVKEYEKQPFQEIEVEQNSGLSKLLVGAFTFLLGLIIGAGALYVFMQTAAKPAEVPALPPATEDISMSSFENLRRTLDDNPAAYIERYAATPKDSIDYFLLGRAYLLAEKYPEAKQAFEESRNKLGELPESEDSNAVVLANDIAAYLAIIGNPNAQKAFSDEVKRANAQTDEAANTEATNTNSAEPKP